MKRLIRLFVSLLVPAFVLAGVAANPAMAQDKAKDAKAAPAAKAEKGKAVQKVFSEDDRVRVTETTFKPGDVGPNVMRGFRVTRALKGGMTERTWADGKKEKVEWKTGEVKVQEPEKQARQTKNVGKTDIVFYTVTIKGVK
jgi:hypothetical protein